MSSSAMTGKKRFCNAPRGITSEIWTVSTEPNQERSYLKEREKERKTEKERDRERQRKTVNETETIPLMTK